MRLIAVTLLALGLLSCSTTPEAPKPVEKDSAIELREKAFYVMLKRYQEPIEEFERSRKVFSVFISHPPQEYYYDAENIDHWFALVISTKDRPENTIYIKFNINYIESSNYINRLEEDKEKPFGPGSFKEYWKIKKAGIFAQLDRLVVLATKDDELSYGVSYGEAHLYRLITKDSDIQKLRKEDLIY